MNETIYGLTCDFEQQNGHFMTIHREDPSIQSDELAKIQVNMMSSNTIDHVLPLEVQEIDFNVKFYYDISSKKMLSQYVRERSLTMSELYELLYRIGSTIEASKEFMLNEQHFVLKDSFIFVENDVKEVYLAYIPLKQLDQKPDLHAEFRELFFQLVGYVKSLSGDGVQQLTSYFNGSDFQLKDLLNKLNILRKNSKQLVTPAPTPVAAQPSEIKKIQYSSPQTPRQEKIEKKPEPKEEPIQKKPTKKTPVKKAAAKQKEKKPVKNQQEEKEGPSLIVILCLGFLAFAIIWKLYTSIPSEGMLYICSGLSIAVVAAGYYFFAVYGKGSNEAEDIEEEMDTKPKQSKRKQGFSPRKIDEQELEAPKPMEQPMARAVNSENYFQNLHQETTLLSQPEATAMLEDQDEQANTLAYLEISRNGQTERINITGDSFIIGRNQSSVSYFEDTVGVSRTHIEINTDGTSFAVKDLGSKNGTKLNGEKLVAYKPYSLNDGDTIKLAKISYTFHKG